LTTNIDLVWFGSISHLKNIENQTVVDLIDMNIILAKNRTVAPYQKHVPVVMNL